MSVKGEKCDVMGTGYELYKNLPLLYFVTI